MNGSEHGGDKSKLANVAPLSQGNHKSRKPRQHRANVRHHVQQAGDDAGQDRKLHAQSPEKQAAGCDDQQRHHGHAGQIVPQNVAHVFQGLLDRSASRGGKKLQRPMPDLPFFRKHEKHQEGHKRDFQK